MGFKKDFAWGAATASYQNEGAAFADGKGLSVWDVFTHEKGRVEDGHNGDVACDQYNLWQRDVDIMSELRMNAYRFSLSWPRILPDGTGRSMPRASTFMICSSMGCFLKASRLMSRCSIGISPISCSCVAAG